MAQRQDFRRIGLLVPSSSSVQERDFSKVLPEDITLHVARMRLSNVEADSTLRIVQEIEVESQKLACILACGNWSSFSIIDQLERDQGNPVLTTNPVSLWHALKIIDRKPLGGLGVLLREHLGDTCPLRQPMSAFGDKADIMQRSKDVRL